MSNFKTPILFLVFNRPEVTKQVFEKIREIKPFRLYIAADGPRKEKVDELQKCESVRQIATDVDWECEVKTLFRDENLGCKMAVSEAIDWFFENEEMGIILEDDCLPNDSFFQFCEKLLKKYEDDERIMHINGNNYAADEGKFFKSEYSYHFGNMVHAWGWASWRRAWKNYDLKIRNLDEFLKSNYLKTLIQKKSHRNRQIYKWRQVIGDKIDTWDYQWQFSVISNNGMTIVPKTNQISNIGFGDDATHTKIKNSNKEALKTNLIKFPLSHPSLIIPDRKINKWYQNNMLETETIYNRILMKYKSLSGRRKF